MKKLQIFLNNLIRGRNLLCSWYACYRNSFTFQVLFWITLAGIAVFLLYPGRDRDTQGRQDIVLWVPRAAGDQVKACVEEFELRYPQYRVRIGSATVRDSVGDPTRFLLGVAGGVPPDLIHFDRFAIVEWAGRGAFHPLNDFLEREKGKADAIRRENYVSAAWEEVEYRGKLYAVPDSVDTRALYYDRDALLRAGLVSGTWLLTVSIENGEKIAEKTLNPTLGISGGLSILGGGGIVKPFSNAAYTSAIALQMRTIAASGKECVALVTGNRTESAVLRDNPSLEPMQVVRIADFIAFSIRAAKAAGLKKVLVACMPGKLFKYACGEENTHAHNTKLRPERLRSMGLRHLPELPLETFDTMGELAAHLDETTFRNLLEELYVLAEKQLASWSGESMTLELLLYNDKGERIV